MKKKENYFFAKEFKIPIFNYSVKLLISNDTTKSKEYCDNKFFVTTWEGLLVAGKVIPTGHGELMIFYDEIKIGTIHHEVVHATGEIFKYLNTEMDAGEMFAYISEFIFVKVIDFFEKQKLIEINYPLNSKKNEK